MAMKGTLSRYLLVFLLGLLSFSSCSDLDEDENAELNREIKRGLSGTWVAVSVQNEYSEPFYDVEGKGMRFLLKISGTCVSKTVLM